MDKFNFSHFWEYNKGKVLLTLFVLILIMVGVSQCSLGEPKTFNMLLVSEDFASNETRLKDDILKNADLNLEEFGGNFDIISLYASTDERILIESGMLDKIHVEVSSSETGVFILDKNTAYTYIDEDVFLDLGEVIKELTIDDDLILKDSNDIPRAINVENNTYLKDMGINTTNLYIMIGNNDDNTQEYKNSMKIIKYILQKDALEE